MRLQSMHLFKRYFPFFPSVCFILSVKVTILKTQILVQNCLDWLGKNLYARTISKKHLPKQFTTSTINSYLAHSILCIWWFHYNWEQGVGRNHKHILRPTYLSKKFTLYFCTDLILLQEFIVRRYNLDSILSKIPNIFSSVIFSEPYSKEVPWLWWLSPSYVTRFSMMKIS